ncbi:MAG: hypothetical protein ACXVBJ_06955 [Flavisolibacter sp.]
MKKFKRTLKYFLFWASVYLPGLSRFSSQQRGKNSLNGDLGGFEGLMGRIGFADVEPFRDLSGQMPSPAAVGQFSMLNYEGTIQGIEGLQEFIEVTTGWP